MATAAQRPQGPPVMGRHGSRKTHHDEPAVAGAPLVLRAASPSAVAPAPLRLGLGAQLGEQLGVPRRPWRGRMIRGSPPPIATRRGNRLGVVAIGGGEPRIMRPRQGRLGLLALLAELRTEPEADGAGATALGDAARRTAAPSQPRARLAVSDFRGDRDWEAPCGRSPGRHGVLAVEVRDPRELELPPVGDLWFTDPETGRQLSVNTSRRGVRKRFAKAAAAEREEVAAALRRAGAEHLILSTEGDWLRALAGHLRRSEMRMRGREGARHELPRARRADRPALLPLAAAAYAVIQRRAATTPRASATRRCCPASPPRARAGAGTCRRSCCCWRSARWWLPWRGRSAASRRPSARPR